MILMFTVVVVVVINVVVNIEISNRLTVCQNGIQRILLFFLFFFFEMFLLVYADIHTNILYKMLLFPNLTSFNRNFAVLLFFFDCLKTINNFAEIH